MRGDRSAPRIAYLDGVLEIMSPSIHHASAVRRSRVAFASACPCFSIAAASASRTFTVAT